MRKVQSEAMCPKPDTRQPHPGERSGLVFCRTSPAIRLRAFDGGSARLITGKRNYGGDCFTAETPRTQAIRRDEFYAFLCALRVFAVNMC